MRVLALTLYLGVGALLHALVLGSRVDWSSAYSPATLLGWPAILRRGCGRAGDRRRRQLSGGPADRRLQDPVTLRVEAG